MAVIVTKPGKYAKCICCGSDQHQMHEFQFFQDIGIKTCITLCSLCVHQMDNIVIEEACDYINNKIKEKRKHELQATTRVP